MTLSKKTIQPINGGKAHKAHFKWGQCDGTTVVAISNNCFFIQQLHSNILESVCENINIIRNNMTQLVQYKIQNFRFYHSHFNFHLYAFRLCPFPSFFCIFRVIHMSLRVHSRIDFPMSFYAWLFLNETFITALA